MYLRIVLFGLIIGSTAFLLGYTWTQDTGPAPAFQPPAWTQPTAEHQKLAKSAGDWIVFGEMWQAPGTPPQKFIGSAHREMIMGGRFLKENFRCSLEGMPFEGLLLQGYDTVARKHVSVWIDNMAPCFSISQGDEKDGVLTTTGLQPEYMTGQPKDTKMTIKEGKDGTITCSHYDVIPDGEDRMTLRLLYKRKTDK